MSAEKKHRIIGFDIARIASIVIIVLYHSVGYGCAYYSHNVLMTIAYSSLAVFTFQSGFLLAPRLDLQNYTFMDFMKKRLLRVWPLRFL